ncbi:MAG TPA: radical SAM protein [Gemmatimonadaceae bacterium]|nr:radical SAM protein [Gemmatimonadaceae bacterium]
MILLAHSYFLADDPKQHARMKPYPPLATLLAAALLRKHGHEVALFDAMLEPGTDAFRTRLRDTRPAVVGILEDNFNYVTKMCTVRMRQATVEMIGAAREHGCRVVVNGSDAADRPALYLDAGADAVLRGEAEMGMLALADLWRDAPTARGSALAALPGLALRDDAGAVRHTPPRPALRDLDALPLPAWDLVDVEAYRRAWTAAHGRFSWNVVTSRGCPFGCNWCAKPVFGRRYSQRSPGAVAEEMRRLKDEIAPDHIWFADDIFGLTPRWVTEFARAVRAADARTPFMLQSRVDLMRPDVVAALAEAGAEEVWLGVESGSQKILDAMDKATKLEEIRAATRALKAQGVRACWFLQLGYPSETWEDLLRTRDLVRDERPDDIGVSVAYPLPGTKFHAAVQAQLGARQNWEHTDDLAMLFRGTYDTGFYRRVRDVLHDEVRSGAADDASWRALERDEGAHRSAHPFHPAVR